MDLMCFTTIIYVGKKVTTFFRAGDHFGDQWIANKMGMIANMILNFPVFQYQFLSFLLLEYTVINDIL